MPKVVITELTPASVDHLIDRPIGAAIPLGPDGRPSRQWWTDVTARLREFGLRPVDLVDGRLIVDTLQASDIEESHNGRDHHDIGSNNGADPDTRCSDP